MKNFIVYKSSAGSGKTYTLVREYLFLAISYPSYFKQILAITFTNKAANEMKNRVVTSLLHLSNPNKFNDSAAIRFMLPDLSERTGLLPEQVALKAGEVLSALLHDYDDFAVRTIDSFVSRIIRTFAHDLHLPVDFEIEMDQDVLLIDATDRLIAKAGIDPELTRILIEFTESKAEDEKSWHIETDIRLAGKSLFSEDGYKYASQLKEITPAKVLIIIREVRKFHAEFRESIASPAKEALQIIKDNHVEIESFYFGRQGIGSFFNAIANGQVKLPNSRVVDTIQKDSWIGNKKDIIQCEAILRIKPVLLEKYLLIEKLLEKEYRNYKLLELVSRNLYQLGVISAVEKELEEVKKERNVLHVSEFNKLITDIIIREPVPFIYERTGEKYKHYLVDEFQDTSELQWKNLLPLITNSLATAQFNLVVGDGKQAIYRFRNGQVEQFMLLPNLPAAYDQEVFADARHALRNNYDEKLLNSNFRSLPAIIEFNNEFFEFVSQKLDDSLRSIYDKQEQIPVPGRSGGTVSIDFLEAGDAQSFKEMTLDRILGIINDLKLKGYSYSDQVILTRSNAQGCAVARFLMNQGISVVSTEALLLSSSPKVNFIVSVLTMLSNPGDMISTSSVLIYLILNKQLKHEPEELGSLIQSNDIEQVLLNSGIVFSRKLLLRLPLYDMCEEVLRVFEMDLAPYDPYIQFFLEFVNRYSQKETYELQDLLLAWNENKGKLSVIVPEGIDAVRIMTIHKAKGLEFPVVIWPFATEFLKTTMDKVWIKPTNPVLSGLPVALLPVTSELESVGYGEEYRTERNKSLLDMINMIYVAFTRPVDRLYVLSKLPSKNKSESMSLPVLLRDYLIASNKNWAVNGSIYHYGEEDFLKKEKNVERVAVPTIDNFISNSWHGRINIAKRAPEIWEGVNAGDQQAWGELVHDSLSKVSASKDIDKTLENICLNAQLSESQAQRLNRQVRTVLNHELLSPLFACKASIQSERGVLLPDGAVVRPDQVIIDNEKVSLLEFKTGKPLEDHLKQIQRYADALSDMGYRNIMKYLVYIDDEKVDVRIVE